MRLILVSILLLFALNGIAQSQENYRLLQTRTADIQSNEGKTIAKMVILEGIRNEICLLDCSEKRTEDFYTAEFKFYKPSHLISHNIFVVLQFNKQIDAAYCRIEGTAKNIYSTVAANKLGTSIQASELSSDGLITMTILSRKSLITSISGIAGQVKQLVEAK